jgi:hypothetical protein
LNYYSPPAKAGGNSNPPFKNNPPFKAGGNSINWIGIYANLKNDACRIRALAKQI